MLASARLVLLRRETSLPLDRLKKRADAILNETNSLFCKRTLLSTALPIFMLLFLKELVCHVIGGKSSAQPDKSSDTASEPATGLEENADSTPLDLPHLGEGPEAARGHFELKIRDETGEIRWGVDATKILKRTLRLWKAQDRSPLTEIILVGNDLAAKQEENKLLQHGARPLYAMRPEGRTYALKREGAAQIINLARIFNTPRTNEPRTLFSFIRQPLVWFYYRTRLQSIFVIALPYGLAYAQLAQIERDTKLSRKAADELSSKLYWDLAFATSKRFRYWAMVPGWLIVFAMVCLRNRLGRTETTGAKKSDLSQ